MMMNFGYGSMFGYSGGIFAFAGFITWFVWILVGIFLAIFLWQKISKK